MKILEGYRDHLSLIELQWQDPLINQKAKLTWIYQNTKLYMLTAGRPIPRKKNVKNKKSSYLGYENLKIGLECAGIKYIQMLFYIYTMGFAPAR